MKTGNKINSYLNGEHAKHTSVYGKRMTAKRRRNLKDLNPEQVAEIKQTFDGQGYDEWYKEYVYHGYGLSK